MIARNINIDMLRVLFKEDVPIANIAIILDTAEAEINYAISQLRKKNPEEWPKRNKGFVREKLAEEPTKEKVEIKSSFSQILPPVEKVNSDVVTSMMTPEEMERIGGMSKQTTDSTGAKIPKTNRYFGPTKPQEKEEDKPIEEVIQVKKPEDLTKEIYLSLKTAGRKNTQIEREYNFKPNQIYGVLKEWEIPPSSKQHTKNAILETGGILALNASNGVNVDQGDKVKSIKQPTVETIQEEPITGDSEKIKLNDEQAVELKEAIESVNSSDIKSTIPSGTLVKDTNTNQYITIHLRVKGQVMNRFEQRQQLTNEADEFVTGVEAHDIDFPRAAGELFAVFQKFAYLVEAELQGLMPRGNVGEKVVEFFEHHNELHLEKVASS